MAVNFIATPTLPKVTLSAAASIVGTGAEFTLPKLTLQATLDVNYWRGAPVLPAITLTSELKTGLAFSAEFALPRISLSSQVVQNVLLSAEFTLPKVELDAQVQVGIVLSGTPELPTLTLVSQLRSDAQFVAQFQLPAVQLSSSLLSSVVANYRTWALNLRRNALTEYDGFDFNSYAVFNGRVLACGASGVVVLGDYDLDAAAPISAEWRTGISDFGFSQHSRVPRLYVAGSQSGDLHFKAITKENGSRTYALPWNNIAGHTQRRVPVGKGPRSRFWQFGATNVDGANFSTTSVMAYPTRLRRRVS